MELVPCIFPDLAVSLIEPQHCLRGVRRAGSEFLQLYRSHRLIPEKWIAEHLGEFGDGLGVVILGKLFQIQLKGLPELEQKWDGDRPLIVFDQVQIAWRNADFVGHFRLAHAEIASETANFWPQHRLAVKRFHALILLHVWRAHCTL